MWKHRKTLSFLTVFLALAVSVLINIAWSTYPGDKTFKAGTQWRPNPTWKGGLNSTFTLGKDFTLENIAYPDLALRMRKASEDYWINITSGSNVRITINGWFESSSPEVQLQYMSYGSVNSRLYVGSKGRPTSVTGVSSWTWDSIENVVNYTSLDPSTVELSWAGSYTYEYTFYGLYNETTGLRIYDNVTVTTYFVGAEQGSESFILNGTYTYTPDYQPRYFHFELGANDREYWVSETEFSSSIFVFNDDTTAYTIVFLDLAGALDEHPYVYAQYYVNGTLRTVEKRKVDVENKVQMSLVNGRKYYLKIIDGASYTFGELLMTDTTTVQLTLKGIEFPKETLLTYKYVRIYGLREFLNPIGRISITYQDTLNMTTSVKIEVNLKNGTNVYTATETTDSFNHQWSSAVNDTDYAVVCTITHERYGVNEWKQYFPKEFSSNPPWSLDFMGNLPILTSVVLPSLLILFAAGCFTVINAEAGAVMAVIVATVLTIMGYIAIAPAILVTAFALAILMAISYAKRRVVV